ncbi:hypothetical protein GGR52DRAFT_538475 [Hypoxylon sp. FL1284]|nr:hypothetical protein GGR52DRAFT_538475 [Hypoxylon sp. FL1284]
MIKEWKVRYPPLDFYRHRPSTAHPTLLYNYTSAIPIIGIMATWTIGAATAAATYIFLCAILRDRQRLVMERRFKFRDRASFATMTVQDAYTIQTWLAEQEFPQVFSAAIFFALFKSYGIPSISRLLVSTGQFVDDDGLKTTSKRAADTSVLLCNMVIGRPSSTRATEAVARTNYLHSAYRRSGRISDDDMLYTLSLFVLEGIRWTERYGWRHLTDMERCALATFWKTLGEDLGVSYHQLPSDGSWADGLAWLEELDDWSRRYEAENMLPSDDNATLASATMDMLLYKLPHAIKPLGFNFASILLDSRLREAMKIPHPPAHYQTIFNYIVTLRKFILRHLCLPRPHFLRHKRIYDASDPVTGRSHVPRSRVHPWYAKLSIKDRLKAWLGMDLGERAEFMPQGYLVSELGPTRQRGKGTSEMKQMMESLQLKDPRQCPFIGTDVTSKASTQHI